MKQFTVDLYEHFGYPKPEGAAGKLKCFILKTDPAIGVKRRHPAVLILPGGGYNHVSAREGEPVAMRFMSSGYCTFILDYSVFPLCFPIALREAAMAMHFIRNFSSALYVDPNMVAAVGFSAGGHLCGCLGTLFDSPDVSDLGKAGMLRPDALGLCYPVAVSWGATHEGSFDCLCGADAELRRRLSLDRMIRPDMPPVFLWHTRQDQAVPCRNSLILAQRLEQCGVEFSVHIYRTGRHGVSTADAQSNSMRGLPEVSHDVAGWVEAMQKFFQELGFTVTDGGEAL